MLFAYNESRLHREDPKLKYIILILMLISFAVIAAAPVENTTTYSSAISVRIENLGIDPLAPYVPQDDTDVPETMISRTYAMPFETATINVESMIWNVYDQRGTLLYTEQQRSSTDVLLSDVIHFREMTGHTVRIRSIKHENNMIKTLRDIQYTIDYSNPVPIPSEVSAAFVESYKVLADNYDTSYLRNLPYARPKMLIISHNTLNNYITDFVKWKRSKGFTVYVENRQNIGTTVNQIKDFVANHYNQYQCDYLLLLGDVNGTFAIPTNMHPSPDTGENNADDNHYTMITGNDYLPEMISGRFSFSDLNEFLTITNKSINYERAPFMSDTTWMRKGLFVAGNWAEGNLRPSTPVQMSRSVRERMLEYGYAAIDTVFYPPTYPGTSAIQSSISQGAQILMYRGWGDANGWHYPYFHIPDLANTYNGPKLPIVYSIVCNTGDFANSVNPNFGEKWMRMGTPSAPAGCVAFVGPSDLHTKTRFNNSISTGMMRYIHDFHGRIFGASVLLGKVELYKNFPTFQQPGSHAEFYYRVYNPLSDPSMNMWILIPNTISQNVIQGGTSYAPSASHIRINANNLNGAIVTGTKNNADYSFTTVQNGYAILPINPEQSGDLILTISRENFVPLVVTMTPTQTAGVGIMGNSLTDTRVSANQSYNMTLSLKNYASSTASNLALNLQCTEAELVSISNPNQNINSLAAGASTDITFSITPSATVLPRKVLTFKLMIGTVEHFFQITAGGAEFLILSHSGNLPLGQNNPISFQIKNIGNTNLSNAQIHIYSLTNAAIVSTPTVNIGSFEAGETKTVNTHINIQADTYNGRNIPLKFTISDNQNYSIKTFYSVVAGNPTTTDPTGPCEYGYFAYDSFDTAHPQHPTYQWIPIDPSEGGQGEVYLVVDDGSRTVNLPFTFRFYGQDYNQITICSNGWLSFGQTWMFDFFNHYIPAALGPKAMIAGYWDDLKGMKTGTTPEGVGIFNDMRISYWHDAANNRYIVEWNDAYNQFTIEAMENASLEKFQIILYPQQGRDGDIVIQYHTVDNPGITTNYCTVGIEDHTQMKGLTYTYSNVYPPTATTLQAGLAVKFTTMAPDAYVSDSDLISSIPFALSQNYPNPFNPTTTISFNLKNSGNASLRVFNMKGQVVRTLQNGSLGAGHHHIVWDGKDDSGRNSSSGLYFYQLKANGYSDTRKMLLMK